MVSSLRSSAGGLVLAALLTPCFAQSGARVGAAAAADSEGTPPASSAAAAHATSAPAAFPAPPAGTAPGSIRVAQAAPAPAATVEQNAGASIAKGGEIFANTCVICHGEDGQGGSGGGAPLAGVTDPAAAMQTITGGRNSMPPFDGVLTPEQIRDVAAYVVERLSEKAR
jgi:mono/diheme cytochrome c family protein